MRWIERWIEMYANTHLVHFCLQSANRLVWIPTRSSPLLKFRIGSLPCFILEAILLGTWKHLIANIRDWIIIWTTSWILAALFDFCFSYMVTALWNSPKQSFSWAVLPFFLGKVGCTEIANKLLWSSNHIALVTVVKRDGLGGRPLSSS